MVHNVQDKERFLNQRASLNNSFDGVGLPAAGMKTGRNHGRDLSVNRSTFRQAGNSLFL